MEELKNALFCAVGVALATAAALAIRAFVGGEAPDCYGTLASVAAFLALVEASEANRKLDKLVDKGRGSSSKHPAEELPCGGENGR